MSRSRSGLANHRRAYNCCYTISFPPIIRRGLFIYFEANDERSYSGSGDTWKNIGSGGADYDGTLIGTPPPIFVNDSGLKSFQFTRELLNNDTAYENYNGVQFLRANAISNDFTYCAWIKTTEVGYADNHYNLMFIVSSEIGGTSNDFGFGIDVDGKLAYGDGAGGGSDLTIRTTESVNTGTWTFVAITRQKLTGQVALYINGVSNTNGVCNIGNTLNGTPYELIGSESDAPGYTFGGNIGALLGYTRVLSPQEILINFMAQRRLYHI